MSSDEDVILGARRGSPLLAGLGQNGNYLSSDRTPLFGKVDRLVNLRDDQMIILDEEDYEVVSMSSGEIISVDEEILPDDSETVEKKGYKHFMLKEIHEQPRVIRRILSKYVENEDVADLKIPKTFIDGLREGGRIILTACGSSWHAGLTAEYFLESSLDVPVEVEYASELRYRDPVIRENDLVIGISQSGQTADTIGALEEVIKRGANVLGVINTPRSSIDELVNEQVDEGESATLYVEAGQEIGVASTKAYTAQLMVLNMLNLYLGRELGTISEEERKASIDEARKLPSYMEEILAFDDDIREIAEEYEWEEGGNALFMGRNINFPTALEGALKLKEISYVHAEGYPAAEMKHGPIALVDENMPCFFIAGEGNGIYQKVLSNMQEVKARDSGSVLAIADHDDPELYNNADRVIEVSKTRMEYSPILNVVPLQLFSYHVADLMDRDVDQPRNLAKSVTVE